MMEMNPVVPNCLPASTMLDERGPTMKEEQAVPAAQEKAPAEPRPEQEPEAEE